MAHALARSSTSSGLEVTELRHAYGRLTEDYTALNKRLEQQLVELDEARRQVEASGRKLALFAERAPIAVVELDAEGRIQRLNQAAENLFGWSSSELAQQNASMKVLVHPEFHDEFDAQWRQLIATRTPVSKRCSCCAGTRAWTRAIGPSSWAKATRSNSRPRSRTHT